MALLGRFYEPLHRCHPRFEFVGFHRLSGLVEHVIGRTSLDRRRYVRIAENISQHCPDSEPNRLLFAILDLSQNRLAFQALRSDECDRSGAAAASCCFLSDRGRRDPRFADILDFNRGSFRLSSARSCENVPKALVFVPSGLLLLRVIAGQIVTSVVYSVWLLSFGYFLLLSLAFVKRCAELSINWHELLDGPDTCLSLLTKAPCSFRLDVFVGARV